MNSELVLKRGLCKIITTGQTTRFSLLLILFDSPPSTLCPLNSKREQIVLFTKLKQFLQIYHNLEV